MRFVAFGDGTRTGLAAADAGGGHRGLLEGEPGYPGYLGAILGGGEAGLAAAHDRLLAGREVDLCAVELLPPLPAPGKILCVGLNYVDHSAESGFEPPSYPTLFARFPSSLIGHGAAIVRPQVSTQLDYEGELVAVIGKKGRHIAQAQALEHVVGYSIFNDGSVRDYQHKTPQWTMGKNFDGTGAFGPAFVTADELPPGAKGLRLETRLNGQVVQSASTDDMIFDVATLVSILSEAMTLLPGGRDRRRHAVGGGRRQEAALVHEARRRLRGGDRAHRHPAQPDRRRAGGGVLSLRRAGGLRGGRTRR